MVIRGLILGIVLFLMGTEASKESKMPDERLQCDGERIWEQAITAVGGRDKLRSIDNVLIVSRSTVRFSPFKTVNRVDEALFVFPSKVWSLDDQRESVFGITMRMENYKTRQMYLADRGQKTAEIRPLEAGRLKQSLDKDGNIKWLPTATALLETKWWKPAIKSCSKDNIGTSTPVNIVHTEVFGRKVDYYFDRNTHAIARIVADPLLLSSNEREKSDFSDHKTVDGILLPSKRTDPDDDYVESLEYKINVDFDAEIFVHPPLPAETASGSWKRRKK